MPTTMERTIKPKKGICNLLSGAFIGGFFAALFVAMGIATSTIREYRQAEWDRESLHREPKAPLSVEQKITQCLVGFGGVSFGAFTGSIFGASFVAVIGFFGRRGWETFVLITWGLVVGAATGIFLGVYMVRGLLDSTTLKPSEDLHFYALASAVVLGCCFGACNGVFVAIGVRHVFARLLREVP